MLRTFGDDERASEETGCTGARVVGAAPFINAIMASCVISR